MPPQTPGSTAPGPERPLASYASVAPVARVYDYLLGGKDNFAADREAAEQAMRMNPDIVSTVRANRAFLVRTTSYLVTQAGIRQFLDIGTGMPTNSNIHQVAQSIAPESRIVYVDHDPIVLTHAQQAVPRTHREVAAFFAGLDLLEPGLVRIPEWRPASVSDSAVRAQMWGAVARKP
jgi:hypothetical protein